MMIYRSVFFWQFLSFKNFWWQEINQFGLLLEGEWRVFEFTSHETRYARGLSKELHWTEFHRNALIRTQHTAHTVSQAASQTHTKTTRSNPAMNHAGKPSNQFDSVDLNGNRFKFRHSPVEIRERENFRLCDGVQPLKFSSPAGKRCKVRRAVAVRLNLLTGWIIEN